VVIERHRQISSEGYDAEHDDNFNRAELARAAASYALAGAAKLAYPAQPSIWLAAAESWPFSEAAKHKHEPRRLFVIAAAFLIAEIERLDRLALSAPNRTAKES
jgi:hypothetical protein